MLQRSLQLPVQPQTQGNLLDTAAMIALEEGDPGLALSLAEDALARVSIEANVANYSMTLGRIYVALGLIEKAVAVLRDAVAIFERAGEGLYLTQALSYLGFALRRMDSIDEALVCSRRAVQLLVSNGGFCFRAQEIYWNHFLILQDVGDPGASKALETAYRIVTRQAAQLGR